MRKSLGRISLASLAAAAFVFAAHLAAAAESGTFRLLESHKHDYTVMDHAGAKITAGPLHGTGTITQSSGGPFVEGENHNSTCLVYVRQSAEGIDLDAACTFTNKAGEAFYVRARRRAGDVKTGGGGQGVQTLMGGTGKYAGVSGECPYTTNYLPRKWLVSLVDCKWSKP